MKPINLETTMIFEDHIGLNLEHLMIFWKLELTFRKLDCVTSDNELNFIAGFSVIIKIVMLWSYLHSFIATFLKAICYLHKIFSWFSLNYLFIA